MTQPPINPARNESKDRSLPPFVRLKTIMRNLYNEANFIKLKEWFRVAVVMNFNFSPGVPRPKRNVITSACGNRILAPYTAPFRAACGRIVVMPLVSLNDDRYQLPHLDSPLEQLEHRGILGLTLIASSVLVELTYCGRVGIENETSFLPIQKVS